MPFSSVKRRKVAADFSGGDITGNGGALLLSAVDKRLQLSKAIDKVLTENRRQASCQHSLITLIRQRLFTSINNAAKSKANSD